MRILHLITRADTGGITTWLYNYYSHMDRTDIKFDVVAIDTGGKHGAHELLESIGVKVSYMPSSLKTRIPFLYRLFKFGKYSVVQSHSQLPSAIYLFIAKLTGVKVRIGHSHLSIFDKGFKNSLLRFLLNKSVTHRVGASTDAIKALYGDGYLTDAIVINNAIDIGKYKFNPKSRQELRSGLNINDSCIILGFVGRFTYLKNIFFLLDILRDSIDQIGDCKLLMVGDGELKDDFLERAKENNLLNNLIMVGNQSEVCKYMMAMDVFLLPSFSEGFSLVLLEAQTSGLYSIASKDRVPVSVKATAYLDYASIDGDTSEWIQLIRSKKNGYERKDFTSEIQYANFDITTEAAKLCSLYYTWFNN